MRTEPTIHGLNDPQVHRRGRYEEEMEVQVVSAALAKEFNRQVARARVAAKEVSFINVTMLTIQGTFVRAFRGPLVRV